MRRSKIEKVSELMKRKTEEQDSLAYMSVEWLILCGAVQGIAEIMIELGYEWNGYSFMEVRHAEKERGNDERD